MDAKQLHILQHSLGVDQYGRGRMYRDHFVTGEGSIDHPVCMALAEAGYMTRHAKVEMFGGDDFFRVTQAGKEAVIANSPSPPAPPKLTRSQQRYQDYLDDDINLSFGEWIKARERARRSFDARASEGI